METATAYSNTSSEPMDSNRHGSEGPDSSHSVFHVGYSETLLFPTLVISSREHLAYACIVVGVLGLLHEGLKFIVAKLQLLSTTNPPTKAYKTWLLGCLQTIVYLLYLLLNYCLMLFFMTLNVWICTSLLIGAGLGYVIFHFQPLHSKLFRRQRKDSLEGKSEETTICGEAKPEYGSSDRPDNEEFNLNSLNGARL